MASSNSLDQLQLVKNRQPRSFIAAIPAANEYPLVEIPGNPGYYTRQAGTLSYNHTETNRRLNPSNMVGQLSAAGGGFTDFEIKPGTINGLINNTRLEVTLINNDAVAVDVCPLPAYWIQRIEFIDQTNGNTEIDRCSGDDIINIMGLESSDSRISSALKRNGSGETAGTYDVVNIAAGASAEFCMPIWGDIFRQLKPFMPALTGTIVVRVYWHPWAKFAKAGGGGTLNIQLTAAYLDLNCILMNDSDVMGIKSIFASAKAVMFPFQTGFPFQQNQAVFTAGVETKFNLQSIVGPVAFALIWVEANSPATLDDRMNYVNLDEWVINIHDSTGVQLGAPYKGKSYRFDETAEKIEDTTFFQGERKIYPYWFGSDPVESMMYGVNSGFKYFDGNFQLVLTPSAGTYTAGYTVNFVAYYNRTIQFTRGTVLAND